MRATRRAGVACVSACQNDVCSGPRPRPGFLHEIIPAVRTALCDPDDAVREVAAQAFSTLQRLIGGRAITEIVPSLLQLLRADDSAVAMAGRAARGDEPKATGGRPLSAAEAHSTADQPFARACARRRREVAGAALHTHLDSSCPLSWWRFISEADVAPPGR